MENTLPFLVYAARDGYGWVSDGGLAPALRESFRRAIGKMPDFDMVPGVGTCGVARSTDWILVYRFMRQRAGDSKGRDCTYLALTCFPASDAAGFNAEEILLDPLFKTPMANPPASMTYRGGKGLPANWAEPSTSKSGVFDPGGSLGAAVAAAARVRRGSLRIFRAEPDDGKGARFEFVQTPAATPARPSLAMEPVVETASPPVTPPRSVGCPWRAVILVFVLALLLGIVAGIWIERRLENERSRTVPGEKIEPGGTPTSNVVKVGVERAAPRDGAAGEPESTEPAAR